MLPYDVSKISPFISTTFLKIHLKYLAQVAALVWQRLVLRRLHVEFAGGASHAHEGASLDDVGDAVLDALHSGAVDGHDGDTVVVAAQDIEHQVVNALAHVITRRALNEDGVGGVKDLVVGGPDDRSGGVAVARCVVLLNIVDQRSLSRLGVHAVEIHDHAAGVLAAAKARNLVDGGGHGPDFDNLLVDLVEQQVGRPGAGEIGREGAVNNVLTVLDTGDEHAHRECGAVIAASGTRGQDGDENHDDDKED